MSILDAFYSLGERINKVSGRGGDMDTTEGVVSDFLPELTLDMTDEKLLSLTKKYEGKWQDSKIRIDWEKQAEDNEKYWRGQHYTKLELDTQRQLIDNQIFQSVETFLPAATRQNPEPLVELRSIEPQTDVNIKYAEIIRNRLADWADDSKIRLKVKRAARNWLLSLVGVGKMGWDLTNDRPSVKIIRAKKLILDPDGVTDEDGYSGKYVGEYRRMEAGTLIKLIEKDVKPEIIARIKVMAKDDMGTDIQFIEWWTNEYMCWTIGSESLVLRKKRNPHWNYNQQEQPVNPLQTTPDPSTPSLGQTEQPPLATDQNAPNNTMPVPIAGAPTLPDPTAQATNIPAIPTASPAPSNIPQVDEKDRNHLPTPRMPYIFLSVFNLGASPVDVTSLITQNLPQQDLMNKRLRQIDKNVDGMNGGVVVSEEKSGLTKEEAKGVTDALRKGGTVVVPAGAANEAVYRIPSVALPSDVFNQLIDARNRMYDLFGVRGITPAGIKNEDTVRGKIITKGLDTDRIGGGITEYLEQWTDDVYNYVVQLLYVYDDVFAEAPNAKLPRIKVSVKEGSLLPKDATTKANQAIELANAGKMSILDLYKALEYPDPEKMAANLWLEANAPEVLFKDNPEVMQAIQMKQQQAVAMAQAAAAAAGGGEKKPSESINFKDLPPDGKSQMAKQAGIELGTEHIIAHDQAQAEAKAKEKAAGSKSANKTPQG